MSDNEKIKEAISRLDGLIHTYSEFVVDKDEAEYELVLELQEIKKLIES